jgi:hypothetical protein
LETVSEICVRSSTKLERATQTTSQLGCEETSAQQVLLTTATFYKHKPPLFRIL